MLLPYARAATSSRPVGNADDRGALLAAFSNLIVSVRQTDKVEPKGVEPSTS